MGAWGIESFENDDALDWFSEFEEKGISVMTALFKKVGALPENEYLEAPEGAAVIAAADILRAKGMQMQNLPLPKNQITDWLVAHPQWTPSSQLRDSALKAIDRVMKNNSELKELWEEAQDPNDDKKWQTNIECIREDLSSMQLPHKWIASWRMLAWYDRVLLSVLIGIAVIYPLMIFKDFLPEYKMHVRLAAFGIIVYFSMEKFKKIAP